MAKKNNPTGLSTGQGKGAAQVFGSTYNPYFKERLTEAKKKDKEVTDAMAKASDVSQLWSRDVGTFKPMVNDLQKFYRDNARAIIKGDFDATLKLKQMQNDMAQYVTSSKDAQKYANEMLKLVNKPGSNYTDESRQKVFDFVSQAQAGNFDTSGLILNEKYDALDTLKAISGEVYKIGYKPESLYTTKDGIRVNTLAQSPEAVREIVLKQRDNAIKFYGEEARKYWTDEKTQEIIDQEIAMLGKKRTAFNKPSAYTSGGSGDVPVFNFSTTGKTRSMNTAYGIAEEGFFGEDVPEGSLAYNLGDVQVFNELPFEAGISYKSSPSTDAIPLDGVFKKEIYKKGEKKPTTIGGKVASGKHFRLEDVKRGYEGNWTINEAFMVNTFPENYESATGVDIGGMPIDGASINTDVFKNKAPKGEEKRYYAVLQNQNGDQVLEPFYKVYPVVKQQYTSKAAKAAFDEYYERTKNYLARQGFSAAYKDWTGDELPSSNKEEKSNQKLTDAQIKIIEAVRLKNPNAVKGKTDEQILEMIKNQ